METEDSLQHSQVRATCPCREPYQSNPHTLPIFNILFNVIILFTSTLLNGHFPSDLPIRTLRAPLLSPYVLHTGTGRGDIDIYIYARKFYHYYYYHFTLLY
jgi:hypothetical protein